MEIERVWHLNSKNLTMKKQFALTVPTPCHENWNNFTPTQKGKFCGACQKEVIDFTTWTDDEIKQYFKHSKQTTCGRFKQHQLKTYPVTQTNKSHSAWAAFVAFLMLLGHEKAGAQTTTVTPQEEVIKQNKTKLHKEIETPITISGVVLDEADSLGLPGVNIVRKGFADGTVTDANGRFELTIEHPQASETLVVSFIGLKTVEVAVNPFQHTRNLKIVMHPDVEMLLGEIVVGGAVSVRRYSPRGLWWKFKGLFRRY